MSGIKEKVMSLREEGMVGAKGRWLRKPKMEK
jgi:hypothetical protein